MSDPITKPIPGLGTCGWCRINLRAIPTAPVQIEPNGPRYHPGGCVAAARQDQYTHAAAT